ncbi:hypothetical protein B0H11DRAFT_2256183 [Mycena galericulata]|nr:hypothetical protein B0H11DRAFT_2256183 [Mycena galericulata]
MNIHSSTFTFAACVPPSSSNEFSQSSSPLFTSFAVNPTTTPKTRAETQARYCARNREREQEKARERMQRSRDDKLRRRVSSEQLRASPLFARYRRHVEGHLGTIWCDRANIEMYLARLAHFRESGGPPFDREDAMFLLQHAQPNPPGPIPSEADIVRYLDELNRCSLVIQIASGDDEEEEMWRRIDRKAADVNDDELEFMFRHAIPAPTFENMDACTCQPAVGPGFKRAEDGSVGTNYSSGNVGIL